MPRWRRRCGTAERAHFYKWLVWLTNTLQATLIHYFYPERLVDEGNATGAAQVKAHAQAKVGAMLRACSMRNWPRTAGPGCWASATARSTPTPSCCAAGRAASMTSRRASYPHIAPYLQRVLARPAVQRVFADEALAQPYV